MKQRSVYYRKKGKSIVIEGRKNKKPILIWTLPGDPESFLKKLRNASFFTKEKQAQIDEKIARLDFKIKNN